MITVKEGKYQYDYNMGVKTDVERTGEEVDFTFIQPQVIITLS